ncbi:uncharacterized protein LOC144626985 [Crassostrea virginica]
MFLKTKNGKGFNHYKHPMTSLMNTMKELLLLILLSYLLVNGVVVSGAICIDRSKSGCCTNYEFKDFNCVPCIGTFGDDCSGGPCEEGYYGFGCLHKCNCSTQQQCDRSIGCIESKANISTQSEEETRTDYSGRDIALSILSILLVISVGVNILLKYRMSSQAITHVESGQENYDNLSDTKERHVYSAMTTTK